jgi:hypothetical protein
MGGNWFAVYLALSVGAILVGFILLYANGFHVSMVIVAPVVALITYLIFRERDERR